MWTLILKKWALISKMWTLISKKWALILKMWTLISKKWTLISKKWALISKKWAHQHGIKNKVTLISHKIPYHRSTAKKTCLKINFRQKQPFLIMKKILNTNSSLDQCYQFGIWHKILIHEYFRFKFCVNCLTM